MFNAYCCNVFQHDYDLSSLCACVHMTWDHCMSVCDYCLSLCKLVLHVTMTWDRHVCKYGLSSPCVWQWLEITVHVSDYDLRSTCVRVCDYGLSSTDAHVWLQLEMSIPFFLASFNHSLSDIWLCLELTVCVTVAWAHCMHKINVCVIMSWAHRAILKTCCEASLSVASINQRRLCCDSRRDT